jgi:hypothetical protein
MRVHNIGGKALTKRQQSSLCFEKQSSGAARMTMLNDKATKNGYTNLWSHALQEYSDYLIRY